MKIEVSVNTYRQVQKGQKLARKRGLKIGLLEELAAKLQDDIPLEEKYRDHELKGNRNGFHEYHIQPDWLLIYLKENDVLTLTLAATGSHSDLLDI